ncbi:hypothetical protein BC938DRAFT_477641, partial [Jimgerdemannia flammicorona]
MLSVLSRRLVSSRAFAFSPVVANQVARVRYYSAEAQDIHTRLKSDVKIFMRSKTQPDLNVVKGILSDITYASKATANAK